MAQEIRFPFQLSNAFLTSLRFSRLAEIPEPLDLKFSLGVKIIEEQFPDRIQVNLKIETIDEQPLLVFVELVGLFDFVEGQPEPDRNIVVDFVNERALFILWPYITQAVRQITGQMGVNPVNIQTPPEFGIVPTEQTAEPSKT